MAAAGPGVTPDQRTRAVVLIARVRWLSLAFGCVELALAQPPPISRAGMAAGLAASGLYNVGTRWVHRVPHRRLEWFIVLGLVIDFLAVTNSVLLSANAPIDDGYLLYVLVAIEAGLLYQLTGATAFAAAFLGAFPIWIVVRIHYVRESATPGSLVFGATTMIIAAAAVGLLARELNDRAATAARHAVEADDATTSLRTLVNMLVHELRTPLSVVIGYGEILREEGLMTTPRDRRNAAAQVVTKAEEIRGLIDELLTAARIDSGQLGIQPRTVDLVAVATAAVERVRPRAELLAADIELAVGRPSVPVSADPSTLDRILDNLLNNALSYSTAPRHVKVEVGQESDAWITVTDNGVGVPVELRDRIFDRFVRGGASTGAPGTGLGLWISRTLAERNGGTVSLDASAPDHGSTFAVHLPRLSDVRGWFDPVG